MTNRELLEQALALHRSGDLDSARNHYLSVLSKNPDQSDALNLLGVLESQAGQHATAAGYLQRAVSLADKPAYRNNLGLVYKRLGDRQAAERCFREALQRRPDFLDAGLNLATLLFETSRLLEAGELFEAYAEQGGDRVDFLFNYAKLCVATECHEQACQLLERALEIAPQDDEARFALAMAQKALGQIEDCISSLQHIPPGSPIINKAQRHLAQCYLLLGQFTAGWNLFDARFTEPQILRREFDIPRWQGEAGHTDIIVWAEQGIGDELMYSTHLPQLTGRFRTIHYECDARLRPLFERSFPAVRFFDRTTSPKIDVSAMQATVHCPIADLPGRLDTQLEQCASQFHPLDVDRARSAELRARICSEHPGRMLVGLSHTTTGFNPQLRMPDSDFWRVLDTFVPALHYVDLQATPRLRNETNTAMYARGVMTSVADIDLYDDIDGLAALIHAMDLVITIDNYIAHLAGRLGKRCILLLSAVHDWRWQLDRQSSPWYPHTRILRQHKINFWADISQELQLLLAAERLSL